MALFRGLSHFLIRRPAILRENKHIFQQALLMASKKGEEEKAIASFKTVLEKDPGNKAARAQIALLEHKTEKPSSSPKPPTP